MENLSQITHIKENIYKATTKAIKAFHRLVFETDGDRKNRQRLRLFSGFGFTAGSDEYKNKLLFINDNFTGGDLALICNILNLDFTGDTSEVIERICCNLMDIKLLTATNIDEDTEDEDGDDEDGRDEISRDEDGRVSSLSQQGTMNANKDDDTHTTRRRITEFNRNVQRHNFHRESANSSESSNSKSKFVFSFRDVEDSIRYFSGEDSYTVDDFVTDFEENRVLLQWDDLETFIFAKKSLRGLAKMFVQGERHITSWNLLKRALKDEFPATTSSAKLHETLCKRKMKKDENVYRYFLEMKEISSRGKIEDESLIHYVIDGIQDDMRNKVVLFGANTIDQFKQKLKTYEEIRSRNVYQPSQQEKFKNSNSVQKPSQPVKVEMNRGRREFRCFNCGERGHDSKNCDSKDKGPKCFKCSNFGHKGPECKMGIKPSNPTTAPVSNIMNTTSRSQMIKKITIGNENFEALVDTGSQVNLIRKDVYDKMQLPIMCEPTLTLTGFGKNKVDTIGFFATLIKIDDNDFPTTVHVVPKEATSMDVIIGQELLNQADLIINQEGIIITRRPDDNLLHIAPTEDEIDVMETVKEENREKVKMLIRSYEPDKKKTTNVEMKIIMKDEEPIYSRPRRLPFNEREIVENQVKEWISNEIIEPCSSEWASAVVIVRKKDGSPRVCIDYRKINQKVIKDRYPLPLIEDQLDRLQDAKYYSTIDLKNGFFHVMVEEESRKYTAFVTHNGQYQFLRVPFGHCNSPSVFQRFINVIYRDLTNDGTALTYLDDLIIPSKTEEEGVSKLMAEKKYSSYELEVLAIVQALKKFRVYLLGCKFKIITDCAAFQKTVNKKDIPPRIARWALLLEEYDYVIEHRRGTSMKHVDALSRYPVMVVTADENTTLKRLKNEQDKDETIVAVKEILKEKPYGNYLMIDGLLHKFEGGNELLVVPKAMQSEIVRKAHEKGHFAEKKTREIVEREYFIPNLKMKIANIIQACVPCILMNRKEGKKEGFLHPLHKENTPLNTYHIDHIGPLESTHKNYNHILVVIDAFTKFVWLYPTKSTTTKEVISKLESQKRVFGNPVMIISDRGTAFTSSEFQDYCKEEGIQHHRVTTGLPRANGQVERINRIIIPVLSKISLEDPTKWYKYVDVVQQTINSSYQRSIATTPFELLFGTKMHMKTDMTIKSLLEEELIKGFENDRAELRNEAKKQIKKIQEENKKCYNLRRRTPTRYQINDIVAIKRTQFGGGQKLKPKYLGPYRVTKVKPRDTYDVQKESAGDGPLKTSTTAEYMKPWISNQSSGSDD